ncbi:MAG: hypothetical protein PWP27_198 [Clostridiales bacterium]|jgi:hypothetical protein|nr:hypothetical protein [Clostridiales bacterium]
MKKNHLREKPDIEVGDYVKIIEYAQRSDNTIRERTKDFKYDLHSGIVLEVHKNSFLVQGEKYNCCVNFIDYQCRNINILVVKKKRRLTPDRK